MRITTLFLFGIFSLSANAQDAFKIVADETCTCVNDLKKAGTEVTDMQLGLCIVKSYNTHKSKFPKDKQVALTDSEGFESIAAEIGLKMMDSCPDVLIAFADDEDLAGTPTATAASMHSVTGEITEIKSEQFVTINIKDNNGRQHALVMLNYFNTASLFTEGKLKKGDKVTISYNDTELYDPKMKEFRFYKVIAGLTK